MLADSKSFSGFAVSDLAAAKAFYGDTLGLRIDFQREDWGLLRLKLAGDTDVLMYLKADHVPATFTILNFPVEDIESTVDALTERGVTLLHYDGLDERHIQRQGGPLIAWFTDPAGNILSVLQDN